MGENNIDVSDLLRRIENLEATIADLRANDGGEEEKPNKTSSDILLDEPETEEVYPFKVCFDNDDLKIFLPPGSCYYGGKEVVYPAGRDANYVLSIPQCTENVWACIYKADEEATDYNIEFTNEKNENQREFAMASFLVAVLGTDDLDSFKCQIVTSSIAFGGVGGGGGGIQGDYVRTIKGSNQIDDETAGAGELEIESEVLSGDVEIATRAGSGLLVSTYEKTEQTASGETIKRRIVEFDVKGHFGDFNELGLKRLRKTADEKNPAIVFADRDIDLSDMGGGSVTFKGTDGSTATGNKLTFKSHEDSRVIVSVEAKKDETGSPTGEVEATIGVHWV